MDAAFAGQYTCSHRIRPDREHYCGRRSDEFVGYRERIGNLTFGAFFPISRESFMRWSLFSGNLALINYNVPVLVTASGAAGGFGFQQRRCKRLQ